MNRLAVLLLTASFAHGQTASVPLNGHTFTLPAGFEISLVAKAPLLDRPVSASFDDQGRLYVTISSGSNARGPEQAEKKTHHVVRLEDTDGDGVFDKSVVYADKLAMPQGALWYAGSLYVAAPPHIMKFTDTDGDGKADKREIWFDGKTVTGCMNDLHGPWLGPDGWIYWTKGAFAEQIYTIHGKPWKTRASHVFRCRPDGTGLEPIMTGGMDNPVGLAFTPTGDRIVSGTFFQTPEAGKRDGLIHAVYGGIYGKDWDVIHDPQHKWTSPHVLPIMTHLGAAAPCGMTRFESAQFGSTYQDNLFCCLFNMQKVTRHILIPDGATYRTQDSDFVVSDQKDFHPTDVIEDADGSLLIIDTGGWYKICCPTSQLVKPDTFGAIYRVRKTGAKRLEDPLGKKLDWKKMTSETMCKLLKDTRVFVKRQAIDVLGGRDAEAVDALNDTISSDSPEASRNAVWSCTRNGYHDPTKRPIEIKIESMDRALRRNDSSIAMAALHSMSVRLFPLMPIPKSSDDPAVTRMHAEFSARSLGPASFLMTFSLDKPGDRFLDHAITYAMIQKNRPESIEHGLIKSSPHVRRIVLTALDQMEKNILQSDSVIKELDAADPKLRETAWWIVSRHPEWGPALSKYLQTGLARHVADPKEREQFTQQLAHLSKAPAIQALLAQQLLKGDINDASRLTVLQAMARANLKEAPDSWVQALISGLEPGQPPFLLDQAATTLKALRLPKKTPEALQARLLDLGASAKIPAQTRLLAFAAVPGGLGKVDGSVFAFLHAKLTGEAPDQNSLAAEVLSRATLDASQLQTLALSLKSFGPLDLDRVLDAFAQSRDDKVGNALLEAFESKELRPALRADMVKTRLAKFGPAVVKRSEPLLRALNTDFEKQQERLESILGKIATGDVARGQVVFNNPKNACVVCHSIGYLGGKTGPDLTRIGGIRTQRDLLEAILFPSASFVRSYEPVIVVATSGKQHNGLIKKDNAEELVLVTGPNQEVRIPRAEIDEMLPSKVSIMPAGLEQQLSIQELADLVAFLKNCK